MAVRSDMESLCTAKAAGQSSALIRLDLSVAFNAVYLNILLTLCELGISGTALEW